MTPARSLRFVVGVVHAVVGKVADNVPEFAAFSPNRAALSPTCSCMICSHSASRSGPTREKEEGWNMKIAGGRGCSGSSSESGGYASRSRSSAKLSLSSAQICPEGPESDQVPPRSTLSSSNGISSAFSPKCVSMVCSHSASRAGVTLRKVWGWKRKIAGGRPVPTGCSEDSSRTYSVMINSVCEHLPAWYRTLPRAPA